MFGVLLFESCPNLSGHVLDVAQIKLAATKTGSPDANE
jgi:hypothetical protein